MLMMDDEIDNEDDCTGYLDRRSKRRYERRIFALIPIDTKQVGNHGVLPEVEGSKLRYHTRITGDLPSSP